MWRQTSARGREMIEEFEGRRNRAYKCSAGVWTCGIGCTGPDVGPDTVWTDEEVEEHFSAALRTFEIGINKLVTVPISQNAFDALCSMTYNIGLQNLKSSTLLKLLNRGEYVKAAGEFGRWVHAGGQLLPGLVQRRRREAEMFLKKD